MSRGHSTRSARAGYALRRAGPARAPRGRHFVTTYYPIVIETEANGAVSAYVPGLPVYAAADTRAKAEQAIRETL